METVTAHPAVERARRHLDALSSRRRPRGTVLTHQEWTSRHCGVVDCTCTHGQFPSQGDFCDVGFIPAPGGSLTSGTLAHNGHVVVPATRSDGTAVRPCPRCREAARVAAERAAGGRKGRGRGVGDAPTADAVQGVLDTG